MLKKLGLGLVLSLVLVMGLVSVVGAQDTEPPDDQVAPLGGPPMGGRMFGGPQFGGPLLELADVLDMHLEDIIAAFQEGKTLTDLADEQGVAYEDLVDVMLAPHAERLAAAVEAGDLTQEQADWLLEDMKEYHLKMLEWGMGFGGGRFGGGFGGGCRGGRGGMRGGGRGFPAPVQPPAPDAQSSSYRGA
jgi:hypothetical protein